MMPETRYTSGDSITLTSASTDIWVRAVYEKIETEWRQVRPSFHLHPLFPAAQGDLRPLRI